MLNINTLDNNLGSPNQAAKMCACRQKKSFFIEDILKDVSVKGKVYKNLSQEPTQPLSCRRNARAIETDEKVNSNGKILLKSALAEEKESQFNVICEVQRELTFSKIKVNLEQRRHTYPLYPTPVRVGPQRPPPPTPYSRQVKEPAGYPLNARHSFNYPSDTVINTEQMLKNQFTANGLMHNPLTLGTAYRFHRVPMSCCSPWWDMDLTGRRKSRQVRFSAGQTGALEQRFKLSKYLSPDERRALAVTLKLSDRQVKTWFQNRRAKWRRTTPDCADAGSTSSGEGSDYEVQIAEDD